MAASSIPTRERREPSIRIEIANRQKALAVDRPRLRRAVRAVLLEEGVAEARISLAIVDDPTIQELHLRFLGEDEPTDVMSFVLDRADGWLEGEVVASAETARKAARRYALPPASELLLYVIHGTLHLVGYRDDTPRRRAAMSALQRRYLAKFADGK
jgi:probable rRNA maturation factor